MPEIALELPALLSFAAAFALIGLRYGYSYSLGAVLRTLALALDISILGKHPLHFAADKLLQLDNLINHALGEGIIALQADAAQWFAWGAEAQQAIGDAIQDVAESTYHALQKHAKVVIPVSITALIAPLWKVVHSLQAQANAHVKTIPATITRVVHVAKTYPVTVERVTGLPRIVKAAVAHAIAATTGAVVLPRFGQIEHEIAAIRARLARASGALTAASAVGIVAYALSKLGLSEQRCSNVKRYNRHLCGMDRGVLDSLLADALLVAGTLSLVEFAREMVTVQEAATEPIRLFWRVR